MKKIQLFLAIAVLFFGCTETPIMIPEFNFCDSRRVVLVEDLTGVECPNCPKGADALEAIANKCSKSVIAVVGIHGNFLTKPINKNGIVSKYDFRNPKSIELEEYLKPYLGKPSVQINRRYFEGELYTAVDFIEQWASYIDQELSKPVEVEIQVSKSYNANTRKLDLDITGTSLITEQGNFKITVYLTESNIIDPQLNTTVIDEEYEHMHVLRDMLTKVTGDDFTSNIIKGNNYNKQYSYTIPSEFIAENMEVVVMVSRDKTDDKSVLQAQALKVVE